MRGLVTLLVVVLLAGVGLYFSSPWFKTKVDDTVAGMKEWTPEARRKNPVGFIDYARKRLEDNIGKFEDTRAQLRAATTRLTKARDENQSRMNFADKLLADLKAGYQGATTGGKGWPVKVAERDYKEGELKNQVGLTLKERENYAKMVKAADAAAATARTSEEQIVMRITESKTQINMLRTQREIIVAQGLVAESEKLLAQVQEVLEENAALAEKPVVRTVEEAMRDAGEGPAGVNPDVDAFLKS